MSLVGGLRVRMLRESLYRMIHSSLDDLGWFSPGRRHEPINFLPKAVDRDVVIPPNTLALSLEDTSDVSTGLGESSVEERISCWLDFYAQDDAIGIELTHDLKDILAGRHPSVGRHDSRFAIYDFRNATPPLLGWADIEWVQVDKAHDFPKAWLKHWYAVSFDVLDVYGPEDEES
jgi:hypothetical protein